jgi:hypothetical protein
LVWLSPLLRRANWINLNELVIRVLRKGCAEAKTDERFRFYVSWYKSYTIQKYLGCMII